MIHQLVGAAPPHQQPPPTDPQDGSLKVNSINTRVTLKSCSVTQRRTDQNQNQNLEQVVRNPSELLTFEEKHK